MHIPDQVGRVLDMRHGELVDVLSEFVKMIAPQLATDQSRQALMALDRELPNVSGVLDMLLLPHPPAPLDVLPSLMMIDLLVKLERYLSMRGLWREKLRWCTALVNYSFDIGNNIRAVLYNLIGSAISELGNNEEAIHFYKLAIAHSGLEEDDPELARIYGNIGVAYWNLGQLEEAIIHVYRVLESAQQRGDLHETATVMANLAQILFQHGDVENSLNASLAALDMAGELGDVVLQAQFTSILATHMMGSPLRNQAGPIFETALELLTEIDDEIGLSLTRLNYAVLCHLLEQRNHARQLALDSLATFERYAMAEAEQAQTLLEELAK